MTRLAMFCNGDQEQLLRIFKSSGQYHDEKPNAFYEKMAKESLDFVDRIRTKGQTPIPRNSGKRRSGLNSKT